MLVDFEGLIPARCRDCITLQTTITRQSELIESSAAIIEGGVEEEDRDLTKAMNQLREVEAKAENVVLAFVGRCASKDEIVPETQCRVPVEEWKDIV